MLARAREGYSYRTVTKCTKLFHNWIGQVQELEEQEEEEEI